LAQTNGHDSPRLVDELVPCLAAVVDEIVVGFEDAVYTKLEALFGQEDRDRDRAFDLAMKQFIFAFPRPTIVRGHHKHNRTGEPLRRAVVGAKKFREVRTKLAQAAGFLYRDEDEVRYMAEALGLKEAAGLGGRLGAMHSLGIRQG
jgi:hypothetical protein